MRFWRYFALALVVSGTFLSLSGSPVVAQSVSEELARFRACQKEAVDEQRLSCFDSAVSAMVSDQKPDGKCKLEDWNFSASYGSVVLQGAASCKEGSVAFRLYDADSGEFVTSGIGFITGYVFSGLAEGNVPDSLELRYSVE